MDSEHGKVYTHDEFIEFAKHTAHTIVHAAGYPIAPMMFFHNWTGKVTFSHEVNERLILEPEKILGELSFIAHKARAISYVIIAPCDRIVGTSDEPWAKEFFSGKFEFSHLPPEDIQSGVGIIFHSAFGIHMQFFAPVKIDGQQAELGVFKTPSDVAEEADNLRKLEF